VIAGWMSHVLAVLHVSYRTMQASAQFLHLPHYTPKHTHLSINSVPPSTSHPHTAQYTHTHTHTHAHPPTQTPTHPHTHTHTHTHTRTLSPSLDFCLRSHHLSLFFSHSL